MCVFTGISSTVLFFHHVDSRYSLRSRGLAVCIFTHLAIVRVPRKYFLIFTHIPFLLIGFLCISCQYLKVFQFYMKNINIKGVEFSKHIYMEVIHDIFSAFCCKYILYNRNKYYLSYP